MNREYHNNKYLKAYNAREKDRGRTKLDDNAHYKKDGDFLVDYHMEQRDAIDAVKVGVGSTRDAKFKPGFFRRHATQIDHTSEREASEDRKLQRFEKHYANRLGNIFANDKRSGDIISHPESQPEQYRPFRHIAEDQSGLHENENTKRQMRDPASRFHALITPEQRERHRVRRELIQKGLSPASSDMGFGRRDFPSNGVADNFHMEENLSRMARSGRAQVAGNNARANSFHVGEGGRSPEPGDRPNQRSPNPRAGGYSPQPQLNRFLS